jgi:hypothetical protein
MDPEITPVEITPTAEALVRLYAQHASSWAPALPFPPKMVAILEQLKVLGYSAEGALSYGRIWRKPSDRTFLRVGATRKGEALTQIYHTYDSRWMTGMSLWRPAHSECDRSTPDGARGLAEQAREEEIYRLRVELQSLGFSLIKAFVAAPEPMLIQGAQLTGKCCICGRTLTDPDSVSRGIGPECLKGGVR